MRMSQNPGDFAAKSVPRTPLLKENISAPYNFRRFGLGVVDNEDRNKDNKKAGVSESQLKDRKTRQFIYDFITANGGRDAVLERQSLTKKPPSIPIPAPGLPELPRSGFTHHRAAPSPPTIRQAPPRPPLTTPRAIQHATVPPPPLRNAPPPPSPPQISVHVPVPPQMPTMPVFAPEEPCPAPQADTQFALMESIRIGATLKPVEIDKREDKRGNLLSEIRKGFQLKPANERDVKPICSSEDSLDHSGNDFATALSRALGERNRVIQPDDDEDSDSTDSNKDEWDA